MSVSRSVILRRLGKLIVLSWGTTCVNEPGTPTYTCFNRSPQVRSTSDTSEKMRSASLVSLKNLPSAYPSYRSLRSALKTNVPFTPRSPIIKEISEERTSNIATLLRPILPPLYFTEFTPFYYSKREANCQEFYNKKALRRALCDFKPSERIRRNRKRSPPFP